MVEKTFFNNSTRLFKLFGLWSNLNEGNQNRLGWHFPKWLIVLCMCAILMTIIATDLHDEISFGKIEVAFIKGLYLCAVGVCAHKIASATFGANNIYALIKQMQIIFTMFKDTTEIEEGFKLYNKLNTVGTISIALCTTVFMAAPLATLNYRTLVFTPYLPYLNVTKTPNYHLIYIFETIIMEILVTSAIAYDTLFCGMVSFCSGILCCICQEVRVLDDCIEDHKTAEARMGKIIIKFIQISEMIKMISDVFSSTTLIHIIYTCNSLTLCLFTVTVLPFNDLTCISMMAISFVIVFQLWIYCYFGQEIVNQREILKRELYFTRWYDGSQNFKTMLALTIFELQNDRYIYGGKLIPLSFETCTEVFKKTYGLYTFLTDTR